MSLRRIKRRNALRIMLGSMAGLTANLPGPARATGISPPSPMVTRSIPSTGETLPVIGLGTWQTFDVGASAAERAPLEDVLRGFSELGGSLVDSSPMYGRSEEVVGDLSAGLGLRPKLFIATKVWTSGKAAGIAQMETSLRRLRADPIDLMQVHNLVDVRTQLDTLQGWKAGKRVRYIGVTHYSAGAHEAVAQVIASRPLDFLQINYSVGERQAERRLLPLALERGVAVIINRPFAGGDLFARLRRNPLPAWAAELGCASWAQLLLKFVVSHPAVTCTIPATSKVEHLRDNMQAGYGPVPDQAFRARILTAVSSLL